MLIPSEVVAQVYRLTRQAKAEKNLTFTNTNDFDLCVLYAAIGRNKDDINLTQANDKLTWVDQEDKDDASNKNYNLEQIDNKNSKDKDDNVRYNNNNDGDDTP